jgi:hypothetical protein
MKNLAQGSAFYRCSHFATGGHVPSPDGRTLAALLQSFRTTPEPLANISRERLLIGKNPISRSPKGTIRLSTSQKGSRQCEWIVAGRPKILKLATKRLRPSRNGGLVSRL